MRIYYILRKRYIIRKTERSRTNTKGNMTWTAPQREWTQPKRSAKERANERQRLYMNTLYKRMYNANTPEREWLLNIWTNAYRNNRTSIVNVWTNTHMRSTLWRAQRKGHMCVYTHMKDRNHCAKGTQQHLHTT